MDETETPVLVESFYQVPTEWEQVQENFTTLVNNGGLRNFVGLDEQVPVYRLYHGSVKQKLPLIHQSGGMKPFFETDTQEPAIFLTPSPVNALQHAIERKPHDTLRKKGVISEEFQPDDAVLLMVEVPKEWLGEQPEAVSFRRSKLPAWIREAKGWSEGNTRMQLFVNALEQDTENITNGKGADSFGIRFPADFLPEEYVFVVGKNNQRVPLKEYLNS